MLQARGRVMVGLALVAGLASAATAQAPSLARYYGFEAPRIVVVDDGAGPSLTADMDGDGLNDIIIVNNRKSRIEIHRQRKAQRTQAEIEREYKVNELPPSPWYDRVEISVSHQVMGFRVLDADNDGDMDILYAGRPDEIVLLEQTAPMTFDEGPTRRVRGLSLGQDGFDVADVMGDPRPEVIAIVSGKINIYEFDKGVVRGEPTVLGSGGDILAFFVEDYDGDGNQDILGAIPENDSPARLWLQTVGRVAGQKRGVVGPESLFEMPAIVEIEPVRTPDRAAASIAVIERATRRIVLYDLVREDVASASASGAERDAVVEVFAFRGGADKSRAIAIADIDADGLTDVLATDKSANSVVLYRQEPSVGLGEGEPFSAFKSPTSIAAGQWDNDPELELFVLSEDEKTAGVAQYDTNRHRYDFPQPISLATQGASPVAMAFVNLSDGPAVALVVRDKRDHTLEIHRPNNAEVTSIELEGVNRPPANAISGDFDHDGNTDVILFTPNEPMVMVRSVGMGSDEIEVLTDDKMPQFGLVQAAGTENTASLDVDNDGFAELLIADANFVRACTFDKERGWRVVEQITMPESSARLVGLSVLTRAGENGGTIVASDAGNNRMVMMARAADGAWEVADKLHLTGISAGPVRAGSFTGDGQPSIMALGEDGFALVRLGGKRVALEEVSAFRSDREDRAEHEIEVGDVNNDGYTDLIVLDSRERMCQIYALSAARKIVFATEFEVFESRLFSRGDSRERQPSSAIVADVTGDNATDLILQVHDRFMIFPQMTR
ncbi:MAG: VCBS repeat-containing protein [Phycisphaerales bacterium]